MKYLVIRNFRDKYTKTLYKIGDVYETEDTKRAEYLQDKGALGEQVEEEISEEVTPNIQFKHVGGGWYELPNGTRIKGKEAAEEAMKTFKGTPEQPKNGGEKV